MHPHFKLETGGLDNLESAGAVPAASKLAMAGPLIGAAMLIASCSSTPPAPSRPAQKPVAVTKPAPIPAATPSPLEIWKQKNDQFMVAEAHSPGVTCKPSGLCYEHLEQGSGRAPSGSDVVTINFREALIDGTAVQSSEPGIPVRFPTGNVIPGFIQALQLMQAPAKARFYIPASLAYADRGAGTKVLPYSALVIDVELLKVEHAP